MDIISAAILNKKGLVVISMDGGLHLATPHERPRRIKDSKASLLSASPDGKLFAFWEGRDESFHLMDTRGKVVYSYRINTDKNMPADIHFSPDGQAVAFIDWGDYGDRLRLCDLRSMFVSKFESTSPIGYDSELKHFVEAPIVPLLWNEDFFTMVEFDKDKGTYDRVPKEEFARRLKEPLKVLDGRGKETGGAPMPFHTWNCLAIRDNGREFIVLKERSLYRYITGNPEPVAILGNCMSEQMGKDRYSPWLLSTYGDRALVSTSSGAEAVLVDLKTGATREIGNLQTIRQRGDRIIARYMDGSVELIGKNSLNGTTYATEDGMITIAADVIDKTLCIAYFSMMYGKLEFKTCPLEN